MNSSIYYLSTDAAFEAFDDGGLILNLKDLTFTELNITARDIVQATNGTKNLFTVAEVLAKEYEVDLDTAITDVEELYADLYKQGILKRIKINTVTEGLDDRDVDEG